MFTLDNCNERMTQEEMEQWLRDHFEESKGAFALVKPCPQCGQLVQARVYRYGYTWACPVHDLFDEYDVS